MKVIKKSTIIAVSFLIISAIFLTGCTEEYDPKAEMSVTDAEVRKSSGFSTSPTDGHYFLFIEVEIESLEDQEDLSLMPYHFELVTNKSGVYNYHDHERKPDKLAPGGTATFWISFEIPSDVTGEFLRFKPGWLQDEPFKSDIPIYSSEPVVYHDADMWVIDAEIRYEDTYGFQPYNGNHFLFINVKIENLKEDDSLTLYSFDFELVTENDSVYTFPQAENMPDKIRAGNMVNFWLCFEIPEDETGHALEYEYSTWLDKTISDEIPSY